MTVPAMRLKLAPSRWLAAFLGGLHLSALCVLIPITLHLTIKLILLVMIVESLIRSLAFVALRSAADAIVDITVGADGACHLATRRGTALAARLEPRCFLHPWLLVLGFALPGGGRRHVCVPFPEKLPRCVYVRLCVLLRHMGRERIRRASDR